MHRQGIHNALYHFGMMVAALSLIACSHTDDIAPVTDGNSIRFGVAVSADGQQPSGAKATRAMITGSELPKNNFNVWGGYDGNTVFDGRTVYWIAEDYQGWTYDNPEQWVYKTYRFYAVYPATVGVIYTTAPNTLTIANYNVNTHPDVDLLMAEVSSHVYPNDGATVKLNFKHALAAVKFAFRLNEDFSYTNTYKATAIQWSNVYTQGQFALNGSGDIHATATGILGIANAITTFTGTAFTAASAMESDYQFVIPQAQANATLTFTLDINGESREVVKTIPVDWEVGKRYTYNITLDPFEITIETTPWEIPEIGDIIVQ